MLVPRRFLPSIPSLLALEAFDRLGTAIHAAEELSLTHSAVSRQLKVLEQQLGVTLLVRQGQGLVLTPAGRDYARTVRGMLNDLARASLRLKANPSGGYLTLAIPPAFGTHWMMPRLRAFSQANPDVMLNLVTRLVPFDIAQEEVDAALHFGPQDWQGVDYLELAQEAVLPVCAPSLLADGLPSPEALLGMPLLHLESRPGAWEEWFEAQGCPCDGLTGMLFDQFAILTEAAAQGFGVALLPAYLAQAEEARGRLVRVAKDPLPVAGRYWLVWPRDRPPADPLLRLVAWLRRDRGEA